MKNKFVLALMLASGMAFAQSGGSSPGSTDQQQPSSQQPSTQPSQTSPGGQSPGSAGQSSMTGCLKGSDGGWVIVAEGQSTPVKGDSSTLSPHNGHQVQVKGSPASDGSFQVTEVVMIADTCAKQEDSSASSSMGAAAGAAAGAVAGTATQAADATKSAASDAAQATQNAAQSAASSAQSATAPKRYSDWGPSQDTGQSTSGGQTAGAGQTSQPSQSTGAGQTSQPGQSTGAGQSAQAGQAAGQKLPQTASNLPLIGLLGLASLASGLLARRK